MPGAGPMEKTKLDSSPRPNHAIAVDRLLLSSASDAGQPATLKERGGGQATVAIPEPDPDLRVLYDLGVHEPEWHPDTNGREDGECYEVAESEYTAMKQRNASLRNITKRNIKKRCTWCRRGARNKKDGQPSHGPSHMTSSPIMSPITSPMLRSTPAPYTPFTPFSLHHKGAAPRTNNEGLWQIVLCPRRERVAVVMDSSIVIRSRAHGDFVEDQASASAPV